MMIILSCNHPYILEGLAISFGNIFLLLKNGILGTMSFMLELCLTKETQGSHQERYLSKYHPYVLTLNDMSVAEC